MICLAIGLGVLGFAAMRRAGRCHSGDRCGDRGGDRGGDRCGGYRHRHYGKRRWMLHHMLGRIDASPAQKRAIVDELEKLEDRVWTARRNLKSSRADLAAAIRGPILDDAALGAMLGAVDASTADVRTAGIDALRTIHGLLDEGQRARVADLLTRDGMPYRRGSWRSGPYR